jgi:hypothetical protein
MASSTVPPDSDSPLRFGIDGRFVGPEDFGAHDDLDWFIGGASSCDESMDDALAWLDALPAGPECSS